MDCSNGEIYLSLVADYFLEEECVVNLQKRQSSEKCSDCLLMWLISIVRKHHWVLIRCYNLTQLFPECQLWRFIFSKSSFGFHLFLLCLIKIAGILVFQMTPSELWWRTLISRGYFHHPYFCSPQRLCMLLEICSCSILLFIIHHRY